MSNLSQTRLFLIGFSVVWYFMCGVIAFIAFGIFTLTLAKSLGSDVLGDRFPIDSGIPILAISAILIVPPIGFIFIGRRFFRSIWTKLEAAEQREAAMGKLSQVSNFDGTRSNR